MPWPFSRRKQTDPPADAEAHPVEPAPEPPPPPPAKSKPKRKRNPADHLKAHRFPRGKSGNPAGRPKGRTSKALLNELLDTVDKQGVSAREKLAEVVLSWALLGEIKFVKELLDRAEGKTTQPLEVEGELTIRVEYADDDHAEAAEASPGPANDPEGSEPV